ITYVPPLQLTRQDTKRADHGLYNGLRVKFGDQVSKYKNRSTRCWKPNVQVTKLWSEILNQSLRLKVTTGALKVIDRMGGLDRYILQSSDEKLGGTGLRIRSLLILAMKERFKLSKGFTRPIGSEEAWRIPKWEDSIDRMRNVDRSSVRRSRMVVSRDVREVEVVLQTPDQPHPPKQYRLGNGRATTTVRRSTHPRR
ncbi:hypothetical protein BY996DRAFT_4544006, partial [Phakopsora pachyrhizi]